VGYTGGDALDPTYKSVCAGDGHTEAMQVEYNPSIISYEELLEHFWEQHDYISPAYSEQYKSAIWTDGEEQEAAAAASKAKREAGGRRIATDVAPANAWFDAEDYHQHYLRKTRERGRRGRLFHGL
jgi:peptide-methionine (S)-S-oxide reductase